MPRARSIDKLRRRKEVEEFKKREDYNIIISEYASSEKGGKNGTK